MEKTYSIRSGIGAILYILGSALPATAQHTRTTQAPFQLVDVLPWILFIGALAIFFVVVSIKQKISEVKTDDRKNSTIDKSKN